MEGHQTAGRSDQIIVDYFTSSGEDRRSLVFEEMITSNIKT